MTALERGLAAAAAAGRAAREWRDALPPNRFAHCEPQSYVETFMSPKARWYQAGKYMALARRAKAFGYHKAVRSLVQKALHQRKLAHAGGAMQNIERPCDGVVTFTLGLDR